MKKKVMSAVIRREEVQVLLSRRIRNGVVTVSPAVANEIATFLLDSKMVTVYTMFGDDYDQALDQAQPGVEK